MLTAFVYHRLCDWVERPNAVPTSTPDSLSACLAAGPVEKCFCFCCLFGARGGGRVEKAGEEEEGVCALVRRAGENEVDAQTCVRG